jgi:hypothetical protein
MCTRAHMQLLMRDMRQRIFKLRWALRVEHRQEVPTVAHVHIFVVLVYLRSTYSHAYTHGYIHDQPKHSHMPVYGLMFMIQVCHVMHNNACKISHTRIVLKIISKILVGQQERLGVRYTDSAGLL